MMQQPVSAKRGVLLVDDDPMYRKIFSLVAHERSIPTDEFESLGAMGTFARLGDYGVAVLDYDLGSMNGLEIADYVDIFFGNMPVVLISGTDRPELRTRPLPACIRRIVTKDAGVGAVLDAVTTLASERTPTPPWTHQTDEVCGGLH